MQRTKSKASGNPLSVSSPGSGKGSLARDLANLAYTVGYAAGREDQHHQGNEHSPAATWPLLKPELAQYGRLDTGEQAKVKLSLAQGYRDGKRGDASRVLGEDADSYLSTWERLKVNPASPAYYADLAYGNRYRKVNRRWEVQFSHRSPSYTPGQPWVRLDAADSAAVERMLASNKRGGQENPAANSKPEILLYGLPSGETERYTEVLLATQCKTPQDIERVKEAAAKDGFHSFRVTTWDGSPPDFTRVVRRNPRLSFTGPLGSPEQPLYSRSRKDRRYYRDAEGQWHYSSLPVGKYQSWSGWRPVSSAPSISDLLPPAGEGGWGHAEPGRYRVVALTVTPKGSITGFEGDWYYPDLASAERQFSDLLESGVGVALADYDGNGGDGEMLQESAPGFPSLTKGKGNRANLNKLYDFFFRKGGG